MMYSYSELEILMTQMIRKQIYIHKRQQLLLKRLARRWGVSEAEVIRRAIDQQIQLAADLPLPPDPQALEAIIQFALERRRTNGLSEAYQWKREDAYEERGQQWEQLHSHDGAKQGGKAQSGEE
jgi:hypothetical protein